MLTLTRSASAQRDTTGADTSRARRDTTAKVPQTLAPVVVTGSRLSGVDERTPVQVDNIDVNTAAPGPGAAVQMLERLPGVSLFDDQGSRLQPELDLRGFIVSPIIGQPQGVTVFLDGVRVNEPDAQEVNFDALPMDALSRAELVRGPSALFGKNSLAGSLLLYTNRGAMPADLQGQVEVGPYGYKGARVEGGGKVGEVDGYIMARGSDEDGWREETSARTRMVFANVGRKLDSSDVALTVMYVSDKLHEAGSLPESYLAVDRRTNYTPGDFFAPDIWHVALRGEHRLGAGSLRGNLFFRMNDYEQFNTNVPPPSSDGLVRNTSFGGVAEWTRTTTLAAFPLSLTFGAEYSHSDVAYRFFAVDELGVPADSAELAAEGCEIPSGLCTDVKVHENDAALYAQGILSLSSKLSVTAALRGDYVQLPITDLRDPTNSATSTFWRASPKIGATFEVSEDLRGYVAFNTGFRAPAPLELTCADATAPCSLPFALGADPPLKPVKVFDYEAGIDWEPSRRTNFDLVGFWSDVYDDILFVQPTATAGFFQNVSHTRRAGVEVSASLALPAGFKVYGSYGYISSTYRTTVQLASALPDEPPVEPGDQFPNSPLHRGLVGLSGFHLVGRTAIDGALEMRAYSSQYLRGDEANRQPPVPGYATASLRLGVRFPHVGVHAYVSNLFDREYENFGVYAVNALGPPGGPPPTDPDEGPIERFLTPGQPRLFTLSVSLGR